MAYTLEIRRTQTVAFDLEGSRIGAFDRTAGASRGTIRGRVVASTYAGWIEALDTTPDRA